MLPSGVRTREDDTTTSLVLLEAHHHDVECMCVELLADTLADDPPALVAAWRRFETGLREHLAIEEDLILPGYAARAPADAGRILADHQALRAALDRLAIEVELHVIHARTVRSLVAAMRAHADREEAGMYRWAAAHLGAPVRAALLTRLARLFTGSGSPSA